jgi:hypothetical protein
MLSRPVACAIRLMAKDGQIGALTAEVAGLPEQPVTVPGPGTGPCLGQSRSWPLIPSPGRVPDSQLVCGAAAGTLPTGTAPSAQRPTEGDGMSDSH